MDGLSSSAGSSANAAQRDTMSGYLVKEGGTHKSWKKRWFVLKNGSIYYSKKENMGHLGCIELNNSGTIGPVEHKKKKFVFTVETPERAYLFQAKSEDEMLSWVAILRRTRDAHKSAASGARAAALTSSLTPRSARQTPDNFELVRLVGRGGFGKVLQVRHRATNVVYAMKAINKRKLLESDSLDAPLHERTALITVRHPFVVRLHSSFQTSDRLFLVMEYLNGGDLCGHLRRQPNGCFSEDVALFYICEAAAALNVVHTTASMLYRDLKLENLVLGRDGHLRLADFGSALPLKHPSLVRGSDKLVCTPDYAAPEVLAARPVGIAADYWSLGVVFAEMLTGASPFAASDLATTVKRIANEAPHLPATMAPPLSHALTALLHKDPAQRVASLAALRALAPFQHRDWRSLEAGNTAALGPAPIQPGVVDANDSSMFDLAITSQEAALSLLSGSELSVECQRHWTDFSWSDKGFSGRF